MFFSSAQSSEDQIDSYRKRLRILLILYFFSEDTEDAINSELVKIFRTETKIQKIDFLIRYPSYLCFELLRLVEEDTGQNIEEIKETVKLIFKDNEPKLRTDEMKRFFYGAYEELDDIVAFLKSVSLVEYRSRRGSSLKNTDKEYYLTRYGVTKVDQTLKTLPSANWYFLRCRLIKKYFGDLSASALKERQYAIQEYQETPLGRYIADIETQAKIKFYELFQESL